MFLELIAVGRDNGRLTLTLRRNPWTGFYPVAWLPSTPPASTISLWLSSVAWLPPTSPASSSPISLPSVAWLTPNHIWLASLIVMNILIGMQVRRWRPLGRVINVANFLLKMNSTDRRALKMITMMMLSMIDVKQGLFGPGAWPWQCEHDATSTLRTWCLRLAWGEKPVQWSILWWKLWMWSWSNGSRSR